MFLANSGRRAPRAHTSYRGSHLHKGGEYDAALEADVVDAYLDAREQEFLHRWIPRLFPSGIDRYLDFACGTGRITSTVGRYARDVYGVDVSSTMIASARARCPSAQLIVADITRDERALQVKPKFDLITAFRFFGNAEDELRASALDAIRARLKRNGMLLLNNHRNAWNAIEVVRRLCGQADYADLSTSKLRMLLKSAGFRVVLTHGIGGWWMLGSRLGQRRADRPMARLLDAALSGGPLVPFAPDSIVVAQPR